MAAYEESLETLVEMRDPFLEFLPFVLSLGHIADILHDDDVEVFIHEVALLVANEVHILLRTHHSLVVLFLAPLIKVEDEVCGEIYGVTEIPPEIDSVFSAIEHQALSDSHGVDKGFAHALDGLVLSDAAHAHAERELVDLDHVSFVAEEDLALTRRVED